MLTLSLKYKTQSLPAGRTSRGSQNSNSSEKCYKKIVKDVNDGHLRLTSDCLQWLIPVIRANRSSSGVFFQQGRGNSAMVAELVFEAGAGGGW